MKKVLLCVLVVTSLLSCSSDQESSISNVNGIEKKTDVTKNVMNFSYKSKSYSSSYEVKNDSTIVLNESVANDVYQKIQELQELAVYVNADKSLLFFDNYKDLQKALNLDNKNSSKKSITGKTAAVQTGSITFYEHNISNPGQFLTFPVYDNGVEIPDVGIPYGFSDKASSFYIKVDVLNKYTVTLFRDQNYGGRSISFLVPLELYDGNLGGHRMGPGTNWNDQMTSFKVTVSN
ncbi:hypothetical protein [Flavobacterium sp. ov086]|uniref:hypothetical protein n=1 Tax=Flavobacterium sp. ov086 TaxID=1761785 RepID=UPI000B6380F0|nr:hypothetical protein [Flavobacterium sp. ov086]SNR55847.1 hypothetical protein SAMN04487979_11166 [Flavobacterium sp. ov086]